MQIEDEGVRKAANFRRALFGHGTLIPGDYRLALNDDQSDQQRQHCRNTRENSGTVAGDKLASAIAEIIANRLNRLARKVPIDIRRELANRTIAALRVRMHRF